MDITHVPLPPDDLAVIVCDSKVSHELTDGGYGKRRGQCETVAKTLGVPALRDATMKDLESIREKLDESDFKRARHAIAEIERVPRFAEAIRRKDYARAGELMYASHESLRDDYDVSTDELNHLVETARGLDGVHGSRMTGAGFGGCTVTLCRPDAAEAIRSALAKGMQEKFQVETLPFVTPACAGASVVD
jgi:galactokinase